MATNGGGSQEEAGRTTHESAVFHNDGLVSTTLPGALVDELELTKEDAALTYPTWDPKNLEVGFHVEFADEAGIGIAGRQLNYNTNNGSLTMRYAAILARLVGLEQHVVNAKTRMEYDVNPDERTMEVTFSPPLTPMSTGDSEHSELPERFKDSGFTPSRSETGYIESVRYEVPVDYAREYGFEPRKEVGLNLVVQAVEDGDTQKSAFGIAIDFDPDLDDEHLVTRSMNRYSSDRDQYAITIPKVAIHALRWTLDMPIRSIPQEDHLIIMPANPIGDVQGQVSDEVMIDELAEPGIDATA